MINISAYCKRYNYAYIFTLKFLYMYDSLCVSFATVS